VLVVDTGPLLATADRADKHHLACRALLEGGRGSAGDHCDGHRRGRLFDRPAARPGAEADLYAAITEGQLEVADLGRQDWERIGELVATYSDLHLGGTDASVIALAERYGATRIATLDHRHLAVVRPRHIPAFTLLPT
jgi:predicted nucleic acid-binding protein